jgi:lipopolysaccharide transport system ATP-binding protein
MKAVNEYLPSDEYVLKTTGLSKKLCKNLRLSLRYGLSDISKKLFGGKVSEELRPKEFWALQDVSFELKKGQCMAILGRNGAGKSTLLRLIAGILQADHGVIDLKGTAKGIVSLGVGFDPFLTARENVYVNGALLGFTTKEIDSVYNDIVRFAELGEFMETPVRYFSSGMHVRLGYAIVAQLKPDVLLVDEVLAVGDEGFKKKCLQRIRKHTDDGAVMFVSHEMDLVRQVATCCLLLDKGRTIGVYEDVDVGIRIFEEDIMHVRKS